MSFLQLSSYSANADLKNGPCRNSSHCSDFGCRGIPTGGMVPQRPRILEVGQRA